MQPDNQEGYQRSPRASVPKGGKFPLLLKYVIIFIILAVILATIFFLFILPEEEDTHTSANPITWKKNPENPGNYIGHFKGNNGTINLDDVTITATHGGSSDSMDLDVLSGESQMSIAGMTMDFIDLEPFGELGTNDIFIVYGGQTGDVVRLVYKPTTGSHVGYPLP